MTDRLEQQFGNYQLIRLLGKGGFAEVYLGEHIYLRTQAAIKVLLTRVGDEEAEYFITEARLLMDLRHPHIVRVLEFGVEKDTPFLVMDYASNGNLRQRIPKETRLSPLTVATYAKQVASALQYAHDQRLIHRDVKPENLLLQRNDEIVLSDFGIALIAQTSLQSSEGIVGTATYMAPEQTQGKATFASDQYSLGVIVYEWLSGISPFQGSFSEICAQHVFTAPPPLRENVPTISPNIESVVMTALAKEPQKRFASVMAFANALEHACQTDQSEQVTHLSSASVPYPSVSAAQRVPDYVAPRYLEPAVQQSYATSALDENIVEPVGGNKNSAPRDNLTKLSKWDQGSVAERSDAPVPDDRFAYAASGSRGTVAQPRRRNIQRRISPKVLAIGLIVLAIFLSISGYLYYAVFNHASVTQITTQATATVRVSATPHLTITAQPSTTARPTATPKPNIAAQPTATAIPQTKPTQPVAISPPQQNPTPQPGSTLVLNDALTAQDANQWSVLTYAGNAGGCGFNNGAYHATVTQAGSFAVCTAQATNFANFTYQVQMTILSGTTNDGGGLIFRSSNGSAYRLRVGVNGSFDLVDQDKALASGSSPAINTGLNQTNLLKVVARGSSISLYVNNQLIANVNDSLSSSGAIGMMAVDFTNPTDVAFNNAQVWQ
jgi:eukaryotic-like serine/threonine-protein kinase